MLYLPRPGRTRRAAGRRARRHNHGAVAGRLAPGDRTYRLRDQDDAARHDRPARREDLSGGRDDAARRQRRSVDRGHRVVRAQQFRQPRVVHQRGGCRQGARLDRGAQDHVDARRTGGDGSACHGRAADLEGHGQPQRAGGGSRVDVHDVEHGRAAAARDVVPGGAAGGRPSRGDSIRVAGWAGRWRGRWSWPRRRARGGTRRRMRPRAARRRRRPRGAPRPPAPPPARRATGVHAATAVSAAGLQGGGLDGRDELGTAVAQGEGKGTDHRNRVRARAREVREDYPDGDRRAAGQLVHSEAAAVRTGRSKRRRRSQRASHWRADRSIRPRGDSRAGTRH